MLEMCASRIRIPQTPNNLTVYTSRPCEYIYRGTYRNHNHDPKTSKHLETHPAKLHARSCSNTTTRAQHCLGLPHFLAKKTRSSPLPRMKIENTPNGSSDQRHSRSSLERGMERSAHVPRKTSGRRKRRANQSTSKRLPANVRVSDSHTTKLTPDNLHLATARVHLPRYLPQSQP